MQHHGGRNRTASGTATVPADHTRLPQSEQIRETAVLMQSGSGRKSQRRVIRDLRDSDVRVRGRHQALRSGDIGTPLEK